MLYNKNIFKFFVNILLVFAFVTSTTQALTEFLDGSSSTRKSNVSAMTPEPPL